MVAIGHARRRAQAGGALIIVTITVTMLILLGVVALQSIGVDLVTVGAERSSETALYTAEAGIHWAMDELAVNYGLDPVSPDFAPLFALPTVTAHPQWGPAELVGWHQLHAPDLSRSYGDHQFRVAVCPHADPPPACAPASPPEEKTILIRSLGMSSDGARRMLEVAVSF